MQPLQVAGVVEQAPGLDLRHVVLGDVRADRRGLMLAYAVGLVSLPLLAWLTYLELAVIGAVCIWCVTYAVLMIVTWIVSLMALRTAPAEPT